MAAVKSVIISEENIQERMGVATLTRMAFDRQDLTQIATKLMVALARDPTDAGVLMDLSTIEQLKGNQEGGLHFQDVALSHCQLYKTQTSTRQEKLKLLALAAPVQMGGNTPIDFLLTGSDICLTTLYISPDLPIPTPIPEHDLAIVVAPGDSDASRRFLDEIERQLVNWPTPVLNKPDRIVHLERDQLSNMLCDVPGLVVPRMARSDRSALAAVGNGETDISDILSEAAFPVVVRPVGSHAGRNLEKLTCNRDVLAYLHHCDDQEFFVSDFIDYSSEDGAFRKSRIVFVDGVPFACHLAIADQWKVWYLNADMEQNDEKRAEEELFMARFNDDFCERHAAAFADLVKHVDLEYFGIDCAEDRDGNLVVFEADNALIVHDMDSHEVFPYKKPQMQKVFSAFAGMIRSHNPERPMHGSIRSGLREVGVEWPGPDPG
ncbi:MAG: hypothetical protein ABJ350_21890 [Anderseniella sp.]